MRLRTTLFVATIIFSLSSCLKSEDKYGFGADPGTPVTEVFDVVTDGTEKVIALNASPAVETVGTITLRVHSPKSRAGSVHVKLATSAAAGYDPLPQSGYSLDLEYDVSRETGELVVPI